MHDIAALYGYLPRTNTFTRIATVTCNRPTDLAIDQAGRAFMIAGFTLYRLNLQTGVCTPLATLPELLLTLQFLPAGLVDPNVESLVGYGPTSYWQFDPATGTATALGSSDLGFNQIPSGDLTALEDGGAFLTVKDWNNGNVCADCLVRINPGTGSVVERYGPIGVASVWGLATFDDELYGFTNQGEAVRLELLNDGGVTAGDDGVNGRQTQKVLAEVPIGQIGTHPLGACPRVRWQPPQVAISRLAASGHVDSSDASFRAFGDPRGWNDLLPIPGPAIEHEDAESCHIPSGEEQVIGLIARGLRIVVPEHALPRKVEILELKRLGQVRLQRLKHGLAGQFLEGDAGNVEVPIVVEEVRAWLLGPSGRCGIGAARAARRIVDTGTRSQETADRGALLDGKKTARFLDAHIANRALEIDRAVRDVLTVEHRQDTLSGRRQVADLGSVPVAVDNPALLHYEEGRGRQRVQRLFNSLQG